MSGGNRLDALVDGVVEAIERVECALCALLAVLLCLLLCANVALRYVFGAPLYYAEEVCVVLMIWMAFIASSIAVGRREMIAVTLVQDLLGPAARRWLGLAVHVLTFAIAAVFLYWSVVWLRSPSAARDVILTLGVPKWPSYLIVPVFFALAAVKSVRNVAIAVRTPAA